MPSHRDLVEEEFSRQAPSFEDRKYAFGDPRALSWILENVPPDRAELVLDVAGGTGHVARAYAEHVRCAVVLDLTDEMLAVGKREVDAAGLTNVVFQRGDAAAIPFPAASFDLVVSRFAVHHFDATGTVFAEMRRVCRAGGRVAIIDIVAAEPERADHYNHLERLRDPSHTRALTAAVLRGQLVRAGLEISHWAERDRPMPLERWLAQTQPRQVIAGLIRGELEEEIAGKASTGMRPFREGAELFFMQRWAVAVGRPA
jgi:ubiquinone/menaquinone biosynthesis C-methylase UbiE